MISLKNPLHTTHGHTVGNVDDDGVVTQRSATCAELNACTDTHVAVFADGQVHVISCAAAEEELKRLRTSHWENRAEIDRLKGELENCARLMAGALQIVFGVAPALHALFGEAISDPTLTDDRTAVEFAGVLFTVVVDPFGERLTLRDIGSRVPDRTFAISNGRLSLDAQTMLIGIISRIKAAAADGANDPVKGVITLIASAETSPASV